jgi:cbb3-type cytochrome oxidase maturation protein
VTHRYPIVNRCGPESTFLALSNAVPIPKTIVTNAEDKRTMGWEWAINGPQLGSLLVFGTGAVFAFWWAMKTGQFENFERASQSIFDADEPVGQPTDVGPGKGQVPQ